MLAQHFRLFSPQAYLEISKFLPSKVPLTDFVFICFWPVCVLILSPLLGYVRLTYETLPSRERRSAWTVPSWTVFTSLSSVTLWTSGSRWAGVDDVTAQMLGPAVTSYEPRGCGWVEQGGRELGFHTVVGHPCFCPRGKSRFSLAPIPAPGGNKTPSHVRPWTVSEWEGVGGRSEPGASRKSFPRRWK